MTNDSRNWPELPYAEWQDTCTTLHLWTQIVGKVRLSKTPWLNHSWHVVLYVTARGLTTSPIPDGSRSFELLFDFVAHELRIETSDALVRTLPLCSQSVADFYAQVRAALEALGIQVLIHETPNEIPDAVPFVADRAPRTYRRDDAERFWQVLRQVDRLFKQFRSGFLGKCSPVHFFWGSFDHAVTRFSGRTAPLHPGGIPNLPDAVVHEAYSHEVSSAGFWPGGSGNDALFYSYAYPEPKGYRQRKVRPADAYFEPKLGEFVLPYASVRAASDPDATVMAFLQSTYEAAATSGAWNRAALECGVGQARVPRSISRQEHSLDNQRTIPMQTDTFTSKLDHTPIFFRVFRPDAAPRAVVAISHGFKAHGGLYAWAAEEFVKNGIAAYAIDHRGHGKSGGERYEAGDVAEFLSDLDQFIDLIRTREPGIPLFLLGHSAGGVMAALYCLDHHDKLAGFICESFALGVYAPELALAALEGLSHIAPHLHVLELKNAFFSRDPSVVTALDQDPLIPDMRYPTRTVAALVRGTERLKAEFASITLPVFILHGSADRVTEPAGSERFFRETGSKDKRLEIYEGHFHDLLADTGRERPMSDILQWIRAHLPEGARGA